MITDTSTRIASGIVHRKVFRLSPSVPRTETGETRLSLLKVVGRQMYKALLTNDAYFAMSKTVPPPKPTTTEMSSITTCFARATACSKLPPCTRYVSQSLKFPHIVETVPPYIFKRFSSVTSRAFFKSMFGSLSAITSLMREKIPSSTRR